MRDAELPGKEDALDAGQMDVTVAEDYAGKVGVLLVLHLSGLQAMDLAQKHQNHVNDFIRAVIEEQLLEVER